MRYPFVFFDLDGTLTDPAQGICGSVRYALEKGGYPTAPMEAYYPWIGPPLQLSFQKHLDCDEAEAKRLVALYRERFSTVGLFENTVYPGIPPLLRRLKERGCRMAVATGKPTVFSRRILEHFDLLQYFDEVSGISLTEAPLTKQGVIERAMEQLSVTRREDCAMVGDRDQDVIGALACGIEPIGVLYGYGSREELACAGAEHLAETVEALEAFLLS